MQNDPAARAKIERDLGRVATPAFVIDGNVFWGFEENRAEIAKALGIQEAREER